MFGLGLAEWPVCNTRRAEEQKECPAVVVVGVRKPPLILTAAVLVLWTLLSVLLGWRPHPTPSPRGQLWTQGTLGHQETQVAKGPMLQDSAPVRGCCFRELLRTVGFTDRKWNAGCQGLVGEKWGSWCFLDMEFHMGR